MVNLAPSWSTLAVCADESASVVLDRPCLSCFPSAPCQCSCSCDEQSSRDRCRSVSARFSWIAGRARDVSVLGGRGGLLGSGCTAGSGRSCFHTDFRWRMQTIALRSFCSSAASSARFAPCFAGRIGFRRNSRLCCKQSGSTWHSVSLGAPAIVRGRLEAPRDLSARHLDRCSKEVLPCLGDEPEAECTVPADSRGREALPHGSSFAREAFSGHAGSCRRMQTADFPGGTPARCATSR